MARKFYRLKKETYDIAAGAIVREQCDDGTQDFYLVTKESFKHPSSEINGSNAIFSRLSVTEEPDWWEEVFTLESAQFYFTGPELKSVKEKLGIE